MFTQAYAVRRRLERKFGNKFSVQTLDGGLKIVWNFFPDYLDVSVALRDFRCNKVYRRNGVVKTEVISTPTKLRKQ